MGELSDLDFNRGISKLQETFDKTYTPIQKMTIAQEIKETANITLSEWNAVIENLLGFCDSLPAKNLFHSSLDFLRSNRPQNKMASVPCNKCNRLGWVWWRPNENIEQFILDERHKILGAQIVKSKRKIVVLCGCENSPQWALDDSKFNDRPRDERALVMERKRELASDSKNDKKPWDQRGGSTYPPWTMKQLIDKNLACIADFERHDGVKLHERPQDTRARKLEELRELYERTGERFIPKPLLEYIKTGKNPPWEKNKKKDVDQISKDLARSQAL